ncbi:hypothetical protein K0M31_009638 [Melipona bicolor]|uniref:Uncharacterized protein n=1 Tax=Melipona bicolor TaxID=60889 RepID=A0AA40FP45_9HYME|nr:hypothetical protein K0M31_009638 [Melipona bicolor]
MQMVRRRRRFERVVGGGGTGLTAGPSSNNAKRNTWAQSARREDKRITAALCQRDPLAVHPNPSTVLAVRACELPSPSPSPSPSHRERPSLLSTLLPGEFFRREWAARVGGNRWARRLVCRGSLSVKPVCRFLDQSEVNFTIVRVDICVRSTME